MTRRWGATGRRTWTWRVVVVATAVVLLAACSVAALAGRGAAGDVHARTALLNGHPVSLTVDPASEHGFIVTVANLSQGTGVHLSMLDLRTGALHHIIDPGFDPEATIVDARTGRLFVVGEDISTGYGVASSSKVVVIDTRTGRVVATDSLAPSFASLALDERRGRLYVVLNDSRGLASVDLAILDASTGKVLRQVVVADTNIRLAASSLGPAAVDPSSGHVFVSIGTSASGSAVTTNSIATLDSDGRTLAMVFAGHSSSQLWNRSEIAVDPARAAFLDFNTGRADILDTRTGALVRAIPFGAPGATVLGSWSLDPHTGQLFVATLPNFTCAATCRSGVNAAGGLKVLDVRNGRVLRSLLSGIVVGNVTIDPRSGDIIAQTTTFGSNAATLRILDARTGALLHRIDRPNGAFLLIDARTGRAYVVDADGTIALLDAHAGQLSGLVSAPDAPTTATLGNGLIAAVSGGRAVVVRDSVTVTLADPLGWAPGWLRRWVPWQPPRPHALPGAVSTFDAPR